MAQRCLSAHIAVSNVIIKKIWDDISKTNTIENQNKNSVKYK